MKSLTAVLFAATLMCAVAACSTPADDKSVTSSSSLAPSISAAPSTSVASSTTTTTTTATEVAPAPDTATPETVPETEAPAATGNNLPPEWDKNGDGLIDTDAPIGDTDEAMCNDPNLAEWAATSPTCQ